MDSFYSVDELKKIGFKSVGNNVLISRKASFYGADSMIIGNNVRIDDFCVLSGKIEIGDFVHIAVYTGLFAGTEKITLDNFSALSSRCVVYSGTDDYSGEYMTNPMVPMEFRGVIDKEVYIGKHVIIGTGSTVLPGVKIAEGVSVGCMSLVNKDLEPWKMYFGIPCRYYKERNKNCDDLAHKLVESYLWKKE